MHIRIDQLTKEYNGNLALDIPTLEINPGELVGIVGNNGAGKTTLLRLMLDLIGATQGHAEIDGENVSKSDGWKKQTGSFLDEGFLIGFLTPEEYFRFNAETYGLSPEETDQRLQEYSRFMSDEIMETGKYIRQLSTGNKQKVGIIAAMMVNPPLLLLDEPFNFLDPSSQILIKNLLREKNRQTGNTMLVSSHNINHLADICTRVILLEKGVIIKDIINTEERKMEEIDAYFSSRA
ncbi:MAG: ABC transporter ATP-binding protein [Bacteroidetes bacterium]|nr:MAG: ABC transporter ATP-binding protein [Bacteroidota bacterium]